MLSLRLQRRCAILPSFTTLDTHKWGYVFNQLDAAASFNYQHTSLCFIGHTHSPKAYVRDGSVRIIPLDVSRFSGEKYLINVGALVARRELAGYCIYDTSSNEVQLRHVDYDLAALKRRSSRWKARRASAVGRLATIRVSR
jgi:predicted phosphodiesterase